MQQETRCPNIVCQKHNLSIVLVQINYEDLLQSNLLCSRCVSEGIDEIKSQKSNVSQLIVFEDFFNELTSKSVLFYTPKSASNDLQKEYEEKRKIYQAAIQNKIQNFHQLKAYISQNASTDQVIEYLSKKSEESLDELDLKFSKLQQILNSDPEHDANIPNPEEICKNIQKNKQNDDFRHYIFSVYKKIKLWNKEAPKTLVQWTQTKEEFYRNQIVNQIKEAARDDHAKIIQFWKSQLDKINQQILLLIQAQEQSRSFVDLTITNPNSLTLVTNEMITPDTRLIYQNHRMTVSKEEGALIGSTLMNLTNLRVFQWCWLPIDGKQDWATIGRGIFIQRIQFYSHHLNEESFGKTMGKDTISGPSAKEFFGQFKSEDQSLFPQLQELYFEVQNCSLGKECEEQICKAVFNLASDNIKKLSLEFNFQKQRSHLSFRQVNRHSLRAVPKSREFNNQYQRVFVNEEHAWEPRQGDLQLNGLGIVEILSGMSGFAPKLKSLELNFGQNEIDDSGLSLFSKLWQTYDWGNLLFLNLSFFRNSIGDRGVRKIAKFLHLLPILTQLGLNINQTECSSEGLRFLLQMLPGTVFKRQINVRNTLVVESSVDQKEGILF